MSTRLPSKERKQQIVAAALKLAERRDKRGGYKELTRDMIAEAAEVSPGLVSHAVGAMPAVLKAIMREAVATENVVVVAQGLGARDPIALKAPEDLKRRAALHLAR